MSDVTILDSLTETPVRLTGVEADLIVSEIRRIRPDLIERLLDRFFDRNTAPPPAVAWDYRITVNDPGPQETWELLGETVLRPQGDGLPRNFFLGTQVIAWHEAAATGTPVPTP